jgi:hypothetical protein
VLPFKGEAGNLADPRFGFSSQILFFLKNYYQFLGEKYFFDADLGTCPPWIRDLAWKKSDPG